MEELHEIEPKLLGHTSDIEIGAKELNIAAALSALSIRMLDAMANIHQIHSTVVRLGQNIDIVYNSLTKEINDLKGRHSELDMRLSDIEALVSRELSDNGD